MSAAAKSVARTTAKHVTPKGSKTQQVPCFHPSDLLAMQYEARPRPIKNCATLLPTQLIYDDPAHPFHSHVVEKAKNFNASKLHWRVQCPVDVSNKGFIRVWAAKRMKYAILEKLKEAGFEKDGSVAGNRGELGLRGALLVMLRKSDKTITASKDEVSESAGWVVQKVMEEVRGRQVGGGRDGRSAERKRSWTPRSKPPPSDGG
jgi:hypothetical protein